MYARHLRVARLISTGGRGPRAAQMTATDCVRLLIAIMAADQVKHAVSAVETFWPLELEQINTKLALPQDQQQDWAELPEVILDVMMPDAGRGSAAGRG